MDGGLVDNILLVCASGTLDSVGRCADDFSWGGVRRYTDQRSTLAVGSCLEIEEEIGANTVDPTLVNLISSGLILENDGCDVNGVGMQLGGRRYGVVPRLKTSDGRDDDVEGDTPGGRVSSSGNGLQIILGGILENFTEFETSIGNDGIVLLLVRAERLESGLRIWVGSELRQDTEHLTTGNCADINVVAENRNVSGGDGERNLGESGIK